MVNCRLVGADTEVLFTLDRAVADLECFPQFQCGILHSRFFFCDLCAETAASVVGDASEALEDGLAEPFVIFDESAVESFEGLSAPEAKAVLPVVSDGVGRIVNEDCIPLMSDSLLGSDLEVSMVLRSMGQVITHCCCQTSSTPHGIRQIPI